MSEPVSQWQPVNQWQPVTEQYKEILTQQTGEEPSLENVLKQTRPTPIGVITRKVPIFITCITWYYILRSAFYAILLLIVVGFPDSSATGWITILVMRFFRVPGGVQWSDFVQPQAMVAFALVLLVASTGFVAYKWVVRSWRARWFTMCYAGLFAVRILIHYFLGANPGSLAFLGSFMGFAGGQDSQIAPGASSLMVLSLTFNVFIFCYLAFWPGVSELFKE
ncbi:MAG TPA: hypothetical protein VMA34_06790 [Terracidiphilus sp.]|nr:hypothetical protein [Terracidiphilus sp.]